tara:strand:- start:18026 stop:20446 length:2421 start_codon:yes stop_codon:yes gene_type:complete
MKNKILLTLLLIFFKFPVYAETLFIESQNISLDKKNGTSIFEKEVVVTTHEKDEIKGEYAEYNKKLGILIIKKNVKAKDINNNLIETDYAEYNEIDKILFTRGPTKIITSEKYIINGKNIIVDGKNEIIKSEESASIIDLDKNEIFLENFEYQKSNNIFRSVGYINFKDKNDNIYELSQIYIDTKKKEVIGTDSKLYLNEKDFKYNENNKPRIFSNTIKLDQDKLSFEKSIFTTCDYRKNDKCPPWSIQSKKMLHDKIKKTIYYDHAIVKMYDVPIFYFPKLAHPDPTVKRRSGFLPPTFANSKNLNTEIKIPYFWAINDDKNFTLESSLYSTDHPLLVGKYHQAFANAELVSDFGYTKGYKKETSKKKKGDKSHFFSEFKKKFESEETESGLKVSLKKVSDNKYLKLHKIDSTLVNYEESQLHNEINFTHENKNSFFELNSSIIETLKDNYNDKYEYILPEITYDKNLLADEKLGNLNLTSNYIFHNYNTNVTENFFVNDLNWNSNNLINKLGFKNKFLANFRNINYEVKNFEIENNDIYKNDTVNEIFSAFGFMSELNLEKIKNNYQQYLKPKFLLRYAPGNMRKELDGTKLDYSSAFSMDRLINNRNFETGLTGTIGFDYNRKKNNKNFDFSVAQIISEKENSNLHDRSSMDEKLSDLVGSASYSLNENFSLNYNFNIDQNYNEINYNEFGLNLNTNKLDFKFDYLQEDKHVAKNNTEEYFKTKINYSKSDKSSFSFSNKRSLITNSSEFYNLSYEYFNDCLRAGIVYRREFYQDSELEPENSLMFKITFTPFGSVDSPSFVQ